MEGSGQRSIAYLFRLKHSANVKKLIGKLFGNEQPVDAGQEWQGPDTEPRLSGWSRTRRVVVLRRPPAGGSCGREEVQKEGSQAVDLGSARSDLRGVLYEYAVLATSMPIANRICSRRIDRQSKCTTSIFARGTTGKSRNPPWDGQSGTGFACAGQPQTAPIQHTTRRQDCYV